jgi:hypothetical protein
VSSANNIGMALSFMILGKSFIYRRNNRGPWIDPCGTPLSTLPHIEE